MSKLRVLIVGASIAGPTAAYWFAKAGASVTVIERFPQLRTNGQSIDIRTAGVTVMRKMPGMEAAVRAKTTTIEGFCVVGRNGKPLGTVMPTGNPDAQAIISEFEIFRGDLGRILFDMTKDNQNIKYVFGEQVTSISQGEKENGPVMVEFMNGLLANAEYDLVVACDGSTSRTRAIGFGCGVRDHIRPTNCWAAYLSIDQDLLEGSKVGQAYTAVGGRFIAIGPDPSGVNVVVLMSINPRNNHDFTLPFREAMKQGDDALRLHVAKHFHDAGWKTNEALKGMMKTGDFYANEIVQVRPPSLYKGRFALVGDAGYAPGFTGTGTSLAIAGAYVLAGEICKHKGDLAAGLRGYEEQMRPIIDDMSKVPPFVPGVIAPQTAWGIWLRDIMFAFVIWTRFPLIAQWFFGAFASTGEYRLPEYDWVA